MHRKRPAALISRGGKRPAALVACSSERRPRTVADAAAAARDASSWASLPEDLVGLIGWRVLDGDLRDYVRFRAVCSHWRSCTACPRGRGVVDLRFHPRRWMLLPEGHVLHPGHGKLRGFVRFFNLSTGAFVRVRLPLFRDHCVLDSVDGILLLQRDHDTAVRLLHPFTGDVAELPPLETLLKHVNPLLGGNKWYNIRRIRAASISVSADEVVTVMMMLPGMMRVAFATCGDQHWRLSTWRAYQSFNPLQFQGKLYVLHEPESYGEPGVLQIDPPQQDGTGPVLPTPKLIGKCPASRPDATLVYYLVECNSEILVVTSSVTNYPQFTAYRLADLILERIVPVTCIGGNALFFGQRNLCVSSKAFPVIEGDTVFFYHQNKHHLAQYHLSSGTVSPTDGCTTGNAIPSPCSINYHIYTCCFRHQWNKGSITFQGEMKKWRVKGKWRNGA